jgi:hypothetical protein
MARTEQPFLSETSREGLQPRPIRRLTSWYDDQLVTAKGEHMLGVVDDWGIDELRRRKLIWSSWGPMVTLSTQDYTQFPKSLWGDPGGGIRRIRVTDPAKLRLFFLSLLWRAAETSLREFRGGVVAEPYLSELRRMVLEGDANPRHPFPIELIQVCTLGFPHNLTPVLKTKTLLAVNDDEGPTLVPHYRFYFDGLVVHYDRREGLQDIVEKMGSLYVGYGEELVVTTRTFKRSLTRWLIEKHIADYDEFKREGSAQA